MPTDAKTPRTCRWLIGPDLTPEGVAGFVTLTVNGERSHYRLTTVRADDMGRVVELARERADGAFDRSYRVVLPAWGRGRCSCPAFRNNMDCHHCAAVAVLLAGRVAA